MKIIAVLLLLSYLILCLLLFVFQRSLIYFPQKTQANVEAPAFNLMHGKQQLSGWVVNPGNRKALIYYGGNAEAVENNFNFFKQTLPSYSVYLIPYRGYGLNSGEPKELDLYADAIFIYDQIKNNHDLIHLMGRSLGSGVATYVASQREIHKLVLVTPYDSIVQVAKERFPVFPVQWILSDRYLSVDRVSEINAQTLMLVAENDQVISKQRSDKLAAKFSAAQLNKVVIEQANHNDIAAFPIYTASLVNFLN